MTMPAATRPNFLVFIADQLRADHLGCYGNEIVRTPAIDAARAEGFVADRFHVASPICMPNRASLLTGRMPSLHGVRHNGIPLSLKATNFVELLRAAGYRTALVGKSHLQNMTGNPPFWPRDPDLRGRPEAVVREGRYDQEWKPNWRNDPKHDVRPAVLRLRAGAPDGRSWRRHRGPLPPLAARANARRRSPDRAAERDPDAGLGAVQGPPGVANPAPRGASSDVILRSDERAGAGRSRARPKAVLSLLLVRRPAPSVHAAGQLLGHVPAVGRRAAALVPDERQPAAAASRGALGGA